LQTKYVKPARRRFMKSDLVNRELSASGLDSLMIKIKTARRKLTNNEREK